MGENIKTGEQSTADRLREQIRHTESDITETVHELEERLSPRYLRQQGTRKAKGLAWQGTANVLGFAQRSSVQASLLGGSVLLMLLGNRRVRGKLTRNKRVEMPNVSTAKALGTGALWLLSRKRRHEKEMGGKPAVTGLSLAATATKAFLTGARQTKKSGTTRPGRKVAWRNFATAIGAALGSYWYSHKGHRV